MISDGFSMRNILQSSSAFKLKNNHVAANSFIGNNVYYPVNARLGENCLVATKAMVPVDGILHTHTGLLGSPGFTIPRASSTTDPRVSEATRKAGLPKKYRHNLISLAIYLCSLFVLFTLTLLSAYTISSSTTPLAFAQWISIALLFGLSSIGYFIIMERAAFSFRRMQPANVSIYDKHYWQVERVWKFSESILRNLWLGTPYRSLLNRLLGIKTGRMVFDDGLYVSEKTLVELGDYSNFNRHCVLQSHSLEDGIYKSGRINIGNNCSIDPRAFVHYGVSMQHNVLLKADAFVMKGEALSASTVWAGNPAKELQT
jgi:non-ribosomal peptide synthetase-like protein